VGHLFTRPTGVILHVLFDDWGLVESRCMIMQQDLS